MARRSRQANRQQWHGQRLPRFSRHIDAEAVAIGEPQEGQVLALAEVVVGVGETTAPAIGGNNATNEPAGDSAPAVR
jgi:hypothetical protein